MGVRSAKELTVYCKAYELAMYIFEISRRFPDVERYAITGQIRRSSQSVCMNLREAWAKRRYPAHFVSKLTDCDGENSENRYIARLRERLWLPEHPGTRGHGRSLRTNRQNAWFHDSKPRPFHYLRLLTPDS